MPPLKTKIMKKEGDLIEVQKRTMFGGFKYIKKRIKRIEETPKHFIYWISETESVTHPKEKKTIKRFSKLIEFED